MKHSLTFHFLGLMAGFILSMSLACGPTPEPETTTAVPADSIQKRLIFKDTVNQDLLEVKERGSLTAITIYSSTSYFIYKGQPMGYEYELLERLADYLDLDLNIVIAENLDSLANMLYRGEGDLIAYGLTVTKPRMEVLDFTHHHNYTRQVLVQKKPENWRKMKLHEIEEELIRNPIDLIGKQVSVRERSSYFQRLHNLSDEMGGDIIVETMPGNLTTDEIIEMVNEDSIAYTVADQNIALLNQTYHPNLDIETPLSFPQRIAWAVRKGSPELLASINTWIEEMRKSTDYYVIYNKYFKNKKAYKNRVSSEFFSKTGGKISPYDDMFREQAAKLNWDWRLLASQAYQESQFDPKTKSWAGAQGLLQVMPATGKQYGVTNLFNPSNNLKAAEAHLSWLLEQWTEIPDSIQRIKFVLASYNAGLGHVQDAQRLAEKYDKDPLVWDGNVENSILLKSKEEYINDPVVKHGYCRGREPYNYVQEIFHRYEQYTEFIAYEPSLEDAGSAQALP